MLNIQRAYPSQFKMLPPTQSQAGAARGASTGSPAASRPAGPSSWFHMAWRGASGQAKLVPQAPRKAAPEGALAT